MIRAICVCLMVICGARVAHASEPVRLTPVGVRDLQIGLGGGTFDLVVEAERLRGLPIQLRGIEYELMVGNVVVTDAARDYEKLVLKRGAPVEVEIPVRLDAATAVSAGARALASQELDLRIRGTAGLKVFIVPIRVDFDEQLRSSGR